MANCTNKNLLKKIIAVRTEGDIEGDIVNCQYHFHCQHHVLILASYPNRQGTMKTLLWWQQLHLQHLLS